MSLMHAPAPTILTNLFDNIIPDGASREWAGITALIDDIRGLAVKKRTGKGEARSEYRYEK